MTDCLFCRIIKKEIPARIAFENEDYFAFHDINPQAPVHVLIIPKRHVERVSFMSEAQNSEAGGLIITARNLAEQHGWNDFRLVINDGPQAGQTVDHVHLHLLSGRKLSWPPG